MRWITSGESIRRKWNLSHKATQQPTTAEIAIKAFETPRFGIIHDDGRFEEVRDGTTKWHSHPKAHDARWIGGHHDAQLVRAVLALIPPVQAPADPVCQWCGHRHSTELGTSCPPVQASAAGALNKLADKIAAIPIHRDLIIEGADDGCGNSRVLVSAETRDQIVEALRRGAP